MVFFSQVFSHFPLVSSQFMQFCLITSGLESHGIRVFLMTATSDP